MKRIVLFFILILALTLTVSAQHLFDSEKLLTASEADEVELALKNASDSSGFFVKVVTVQDFGSKAIVSYAEELCTENNTVILLISLNRGEFCMTASDTAASVYTDSVFAKIEDGILPYLSGRDFLSAFVNFAELCEDYSDYSAPYYSDDEYYYSDSEYVEDTSLPMSRIFVPLVIGFGIGLITVSVMKEQLKSVRYKSGAADYVKSGSLNITSSYDRFLWRNVSRVRRQSNNSSGGGSRSGGSSRSFSSRSGRF